MDDESLLALVRGAESERVERKDRLKGKKDQVCQAICAFANDFPRTGQPGVVVIGQSDDGTPARLPVTDELLLELADLRTNGGILPFPQISVRSLELEGVLIVAVVVEPSSAPPVRFNGRTWIRVGPSTRPATAEEESALTERRRAANLPFDARPLMSATAEDLDLAGFAESMLPQLVADDVLRENGRPVEQQLASLRFTAPPDFHPTPTGILVIGREPEQHLPGAYVQFVRFDGVGLSDPVLSQHRASGTIPDVVLEVEEILRSHIETIVRFEGLPTEERTPSVPFEALQQLFRNAALHRNYESSNAPVRVNWFDDRVEIHSPGGPYGQVTVETIGQPGLTDYRNPTLAAALNQLGFVQRFGVGIQIARDRLARNGNPGLEYQASVAAVAAIVRLKT
ncbi:MAG TPA: ATP-binding protein [Streptosporangiaceae bacterium]|nr:ATP-binding protein [Streptosporangiaceae bacterium]